MKSMVYFPTFEPPDDKWLRFAILYMESFNPIIPQSGNIELSDNYRSIIQETDLISPYQPSYDQGNRATNKAIDFVDNIQVSKFRYSDLLNRSNLIRVFSNRGKWNFKIFEEKFTSYWKDYCLENNFAMAVPGGILTSEELAFIYMTFLAEEIAFEEGKSIITDNSKFNNFLNYNKTIPFSELERQKVAQGIMGLVVPANLSEIPFEKLIEFRNSKRKLIKAFNVELDNALGNYQEAFDERDFVKKYNDIYSELTWEIIAKGLGVATIPFSFTLLLSNRDTSPVQYIKDILAGIGIMVGTATAMKGQWGKIENMHNCRRYFTNLKRIS